MRVVIDRPPNFNAIDMTFHVAGKPVIFSWGETIYNPMNIHITRELMDHEAIHGERQTNDEQKIIQWWDKYILDPVFRLYEEVPAHRTEFVSYCKRHGTRRKEYLDAVAARLISPLYWSEGCPITSKQAEEYVKGIYSDWRPR